MKNVSNSIKQVMVVFLFFFVALISYIAYFQVFSAPKIAEQTGNKRLWAIRNEVLRGTIYDRNKNPLTTSQKVNAIPKNIKAEPKSFCITKHMSANITTRAGCQSCLKSSTIVLFSSL